MRDEENQESEMFGSPVKKVFQGGCGQLHQMALINKMSTENWPHGI